MSEKYDSAIISPAVAMLATQLRHVTALQSALARIRHELEQRAIVHDWSKLGPEEMSGFARINATAREHPYMSPEYKASLEAERPTIDRHTKGNSHHPEAHASHPLETECLTGLAEKGQPFGMGWLDIVEMVCDWYAAGKAYGNAGNFRESVAFNMKRWTWTPGQAWLIDQVATWLLSREPKERDAVAEELRKATEECGP